MRVLAIDPGNEQSAWMILEGYRPIESRIDPNEYFQTEVLPHIHADVMAIEYMRARGMPTANEELDTQFQAGRFVGIWNGDWSPIHRMDVKMHICGTARARDSNIRQALIDRYGGKDTAVGKKKNPGPLYGIKKDLWSALAIGITFIERGASG